MKKIILILVFIFLFSKNTYADNELSSFDVLAIDEVSDNETGITFSSVFYSVIKGDGKAVIKEITDSVKNILFKEIEDTDGYVKTIIIISLLCGILNTITLDLKDKSVSEIVFYVSQILILTIAVTAFKESISVLKSAIDSVLSIMTAAIPFMVSVVASTGKGMQGAVLSFTTTILSVITDGIIIPMITVTTLIKIVNLISHKDMLSKMSALFKDITSYIIKGGGYVFIFMMSLERLGGATVSRFVGSTVKSVVSMIPVVGDVVSGSAEIAANTAGTVAAGSGIVLVIILVSISFMPVIKIGIITAVYKILAAVVEPVCDKNTVEIIDTIGEGCKLIMACLFMTVFMFIVSVLVMLGGLNG